MTIEPAVAFERARRGGEAVLSLYGRGHFGAISHGRKPIPRFIPKGVAGRRPGNGRGLNEEARITDLNEMRRPGLAVECGPGSQQSTQRGDTEMVTETVAPPDVGQFHFYSTPSLQTPAWRVYRDGRALGVIERHNAGFGAFTPGREMSRGGMKSRMAAARWLWARAEAGA